MQEQTESWIREALPAIDSAAVLQQLDRMLRSRHFCNSRRYPAFLSHIVRRTLEGDLDSLKERILGIEVFKRPHDYDTGSDPVVRITAGEVRKRIALYYHDEGTEQELRIELPPGSYVPLFSSSGNGYSGPDTALVAANGAFRTEPALADPLVVDKSLMRPATRWLLVAAAALILFLGLAATLYFWDQSRTPIESMWRPFFTSPNRVLIVVGTPLGKQYSESTDLAMPPDSHSYVHMAFNDVLALTEITGLLDTHARRYRIQSAGATSLDDLRRRPSVLIAAFGNPWSVRILSALRFSLLRQQVAPDGRTMVGSVIDHRNPAAMWNFDFTKPVTVNSKNYAIVARLRSDLTEGPMVVIAGLGAGATESAGEFVSNPDYLQQINGVAPANWRNKNFELVLEVPMVDGKSGHAKIVASEFW
jgi:hypothetical protein